MFSRKQNSQYAGSKMRIYPIPASQKISAAVADPSIAVAMIYIYNISGSLVKSFEKPIELKRSAGLYEIGITDLPNGVYILKAYMESYYAFQYRFVVRD